MATLAPMSTPRQPFGILSDAKIRSLQSTKNRQNAITPNSAPSLKRRAPSPELSDSENVDPNILDSFGKRKRAAFDDDVSLSKPSRYGIQIIPAAPKARSYTPVVTPKLNTVVRPSSTPLSAPAAAGRSPTRGKRLGLLKPGKRFAPTFKTKSPSISVTAALRGTLAHKQAKKVRTIEESKPETWFFDIFEESEEQQSYRMNEWTMTQSATILDISDDEGKAQEEEEDNKENVDPNKIYAPVTRSMGAATAKSAIPRLPQKDMMSDEPRTPLGDLNPAVFYAEGLDATSVVLVHDDVNAEAAGEPLIEQPQTMAEPKADFTFETETKLPCPAEPVETVDVGALLAASIPIWTDSLSDASLVGTDSATAVADKSIEIWESASAKDENEKPDASFDANGVFALQEI